MVGRAYSLHFTEPSPSRGEEALLGTGVRSHFTRAHLGSPLTGTLEGALGGHWDFGVHAYQSMDTSPHNYTTEGFNTG